MSNVIIPAKPIYKHHNSMSGVSAGNIGMAIIPNGYTLYQTVLEVEKADGSACTLAEMVNDIGKVEFIEGSDVIFSLKAQELLDLEGYYGNTSQNGLLSIYHTLPQLESLAERDVLFYGTEGGGQITVTAEIKTGATAVARIHVRGFVSTEPRPRGMYLNTERHNRTFESVGTQELSNLPYDKKNQSYVSLFLQKDTISKVDIKINSRPILDKIKTPIYERFLADAGRIIPNGVFPIDFNTLNIIHDTVLLEQINDFRLDIDWSTAPNSYDILALKINDYHRPPRFKVK